MKEKKKWQRADEFMAELEADPEYVAARAQRDVEFQRIEAELRAAQVPLVSDLCKAGCKVESVWDLVNTTRPYPAAVPVLLEHLDRPYPDGVREGIGRALCVREAAYAWPRLVEAYRNEQSKLVKDGIAVAVGGIASVAGPGALDVVLELLSDPSLGSSRILLLQALDLIRDPRASAALGQFEQDPALAQEVRAMLKRRARRKRR